MHIRYALSIINTDGKKNNMSKSIIKIRPEIKIQNTVSTADLKQEVNIADFNEYEHLSSNLELYRCGYVKDDIMTGRVTIFRTGKMISVGTKSPQQADKELKKAYSILKNYGLVKSIRITSQVRNIVSRFDLDKKLPIETLARTLPKSIYEPEQFPGLIYRIQDSCTALLFASGKGVIAGAKSIEETNSAFFDIETRI